MKNLLIAVLLLTSLTFISCTKSVVSMENVDERIKEVKTEFAPDKRTSIFEITYVKYFEKLIVKGETNNKEAKNKLIDLLTQNDGLEIMDSITVLPSSKLGDKIYAVVTVAVCNMRAKPDHAAEMVSQALMGAHCNVYKTSEDDWYLIQSPDGYLGWVDESAIELMDSDKIKSWKSSEKVIVQASESFVYEGVPKNSGIVSDVTIGNLLMLEQSEAGNYKVSLPDGREGYISKSDAVPFAEWAKQAKPTAEGVMSFAKTFLGKPYMWGGTSYRGVDCSGFTKTVYLMNGVLLQRDASQQVLTGEAVDISNGYDKLQPGDLVFFGSKAHENKKERVTHVGIYIGNSDFIHSAGRVRINSFDPLSPIYSKYRTSTFLHARRVLSSLNANGIETISGSSYFIKL